jgi:hypothetical protein
VSVRMTHCKELEAPKTGSGRTEECTRRPSWAESAF